MPPRARRSSPPLLTPSPCARHDAPCPGRSRRVDWESTVNSGRHARTSPLGHGSAHRTGDIGWGCSCQTNPRRAMQTPNVSGAGKPGTKRVKNLLKDSKLPVLDWWDHDANYTALWETVTVKARREAAWRCPECGLRFTARVLDMTSLPSCPDCFAKRETEWEAELARWAVTPVAAAPELAQAWADDVDPTQVMLADHMVRRFRCPQGHHPRVTPLSFLQSGCPSCRGNATRVERLEQVKVDPETHAMNREIASQWLDSKNSPMKLQTTSPGSRRTVWWKNWECGHEWRAIPAEREKGQRLRCPECRTILDSLAYHFPSSGRNGPPTTQYPPGTYVPPGRPPSPPSGCAPTTQTTLGPHRSPPGRSGRGAPSAASPASSA